MKRHNTINQILYLFLNIIIILAAVGIWREKLSWNLPYMSMEATSMVLTVLISVLLIVGVCLQWKGNRNFYNLFLNVIAVSGLYISIMYFPFRKNLISGILLTALVIWAAYSGAATAAKLFRMNWGRSWIQLGRDVAASAYIIFAMASFFLVTLEEVDDFRDRILMVSTADVITEENRKQQTIEQYRDDLMGLRPKQWRNLTPQERLNLLQIVANIEQQSLGIATDTRISAANLTSFYYGFYRDWTGEIAVTIDALMAESPEKVISTVCHEIYHNYQYKLVDLYETVDDASRQLRLFDRAERYGYEFENYNSGAEDMEAYRRQACEADAREYAENAVKQYMALLHFYEMDEERVSK